MRARWRWGREVRLPVHPRITIVTGTTFDVSAISYALAGSQTLVRNATSGVGTVNGSATFNSGAKISLQANGTNGSVGTLSVAGGLTLNANTIMVNVAGVPLDVGTYPLITYTGSKSGSFNAYAHHHRFGSCHWSGGQDCGNRRIKFP